MEGVEEEGGGIFWGVGGLEEGGWDKVFLQGGACEGKASIRGCWLHSSVRLTAAAGSFAATAATGSTAESSAATAAAGSAAGDTAGSPGAPCPAQHRRAGAANLVRSSVAIHVSKAR